MQARSLWRWAVFLLANGGFSFIGKKQIAVLNFCAGVQFLAAAT
jgi:hypothetical protein